MQAIPGWMTGLIVLGLVIALGWAAIIPRSLVVNVEADNKSETTNHYNIPTAVPELNPLPENAPEEDDS